MNQYELSTEKMNQDNLNVGEMQKRRVTMPDGKRYLIYYTFEKANSAETDSDIDLEKAN